MVDRDEFIEREIVPTLGEYADDFDVEGICDEVSKFDPRKGYVWSQEYIDALDEYNAVLARHDMSE